MRTDAISPILRMPAPLMYVSIGLDELWLALPSKLEPPFAIASAAIGSIDSMR
ncbi:hypothetical protein [Algihabitans sp.]|uniref:hypothetical protein n=1 Tax=Algihabitans sp. TaxID=2821514 RepID=UPI003BAC2D20